MLDLALQRGEPLEPAQRLDHLPATVDVAAEQRLQMVQVFGPRRPPRMRLQPLAAGRR